MFNNIDKDSNGTIDFNEFKDWLIENNVNIIQLYYRLGFQ